MIRRIHHLWRALIDGWIKFWLPSHRWPVNTLPYIVLGKDASTACWKGLHGDQCREARCTCSCHGRERR